MFSFKQLVYGLYLGAGYIALLYFGESLLPGVLSEGAYSTFGIIIVFAMMILESFYSLR